MDLPISSEALRAALGRVGTLAAMPHAAEDEWGEGEEATVQLRSSLPACGTGWEYGVDYFIRMLTDVRRLPLPTFSDPFALDWSFEQASAAELKSLAVSQVAPGVPAAAAAALGTPSRVRPHASEGSLAALEPPPLVASAFEAKVTNDAGTVARMRRATAQVRSLIKSSSLLSSCTRLLEQFEESMAASAAGHADADLKAIVTHLPHRWRPANGRKRPPGGAPRPSKEWRLLARAMYPSHAAISFSQQIMVVRGGRKRRSGELSQAATNLMRALRPPAPPPNYGDVRIR